MLFIFDFSLVEKHIESIVIVQLESFFYLVFFNPFGHHDSMSIDLKIFITMKEEVGLTS